MQHYYEAVQEPLGIRVLIQNEAGEYLTGGPTEWHFTEQRERATVFDYVRDAVPEQLALIRRTHNHDWRVVKLDPREVYEICDHCGSQVMAMKVFFNGTEYLCQECKNSTETTRRNASEPAT
jgi:formylmethanofuran dehydrogenase subunit E